MSQTDPSRPDAQFPPHYYPPYPYRQDDEISLLDLGKVIYKRKRVLLLIWLLCVGAAFIYVLFKPSHYVFQSVVETGNYPNAEGDLLPVEPENSLLSRVRSSSIPSALRTLSQETGKPIDHFPDVKVDLAENSGMLVLSSQVKADPAEQQLAHQLHQQIINNLLSAHHQLLQTHRDQRDMTLRNLQSDLLALESRAQLDTKLAQLNVAKSGALARLEQLSNDELRQIEVQRLQRSLSSAQRELQSLQEREVNLREQIARQPEKESLLLKQLERAEADLSELRQSRQRVINSGASGAAQLSQSLLLIDSQINSALNSVRELENNLYLKLPEENAELRRYHVDLLGDIGIQESRVAEARQALREFEISRELMVQQAQADVDRLEAELNQLVREHETGLRQLQAGLDSVTHQMGRIQNSRIVVEPGLDKAARGTSSIMILVLSTLLGGMLGVMAAFIAEFLARLKSSMTEEIHKT
ncbi:MAG: hypothetical protein ACK4L8_13755 [Nitrincola lacisaponensis]|uniref:hypothetical protein n=1 Tax=Nitrincola lacisaponensis TaxID=267850 RepID=UPI00391B5404